MDHVVQPSTTQLLSLALLLAHDVVKPHYVQLQTMWQQFMQNFVDGTLPDNRHVFPVDSYYLYYTTPRL